MRISGFGSLVDYDYLRFILKDEYPGITKKQPQTDTFVSNIKNKAMKAVNNQNRKSFLRSITSRR